MTVQDRVVASLRALFPSASIVDRRKNPSHGYRAVHVIVQHSGRLIEIQVRSALQHLWAELSEKISDAVDPSIKYGGGIGLDRAFLAKSSEMIEALERLEAPLAATRRREVPDSDELATLVAESKSELSRLLGELISRAENMRSRSR